MPVNEHFLGAVSVVGAVGNLVTLVVLKHAADKQNTANWLLQTLAVVDSLYLRAVHLVITWSTLCTCAITWEYFLITWSTLCTCAIT